MLDTERSNISKTLLKQLASKQITMDQFLMECAYWAVKDGFDDLNPIPPPDKPQEFLEFENLSPKDRSKLKPEYYEDHPEVKEYLARHRAIKSRNEASLHWLRELLKYIPVQDESTREKIKARIELFTDYPDELQDVQKTFDAKIVNDPYAD
jgi:hypothetical protein